MLQEILTIDDLNKAEKIKLSIKEKEFLGKHTLAQGLDKIVKKYINNKKFFKFIRTFALKGRHSRKKNKFNLYNIENKWLVAVENDLVLYRINYASPESQIIFNTTYGRSDGSFSLYNSIYKINIKNNELSKEFPNIEHYKIKNNKLYKESLHLINEEFQYINASINFYLKNEEGFIQGKMSNNAYKTNLTKVSKEQEAKTNIIQIINLEDKFLYDYLLCSNLFIHHKESPFAEVIENTIIIPRGSDRIKEKTIKNLQSLYNDYDINILSPSEKEIELINLNLNNE